MLMKVQIKISRKVWRDADATINAEGHAVVKLPYPYSNEIFKVWRPLKTKRTGKKGDGVTTKRRKKWYK